MSKKTIILVGATIGMTIGGLLPLLWHGDMLGGMSILLGLVFGILGIWAGVKLSKILG